MPAMQVSAPPGAPPPMEDDFERKHHEMRSVAKDCLVVIDNLPADVASDKFDKLCEKVYPRFETAGKVARNPDGDTPRILIARDDDGKTLGYAFVEYISPEEAHKAVVALHKSALSKKHVFWVDTAGALEKLQDVPDEFVAPADLTQAVEARHDIKSWLLDSRGRDMFLIRHDKETAVWWNDHITKPQLVRSECLLISIGIVLESYQRKTVMDIPTDESSTSF
jgi:translation initiation factor 3 subunit B